MECLQGGDAKMEQEEVRAEAEAAPSESPDGASAETKETEEASPSLLVYSVCVDATIEHVTWFACSCANHFLGFGHQPTF